MMRNRLGTVAQAIPQIPLDLGFASNAGAWSVRKIRTAYSGLAITLRRSSDNAQTNVSFDYFGGISASSSVSAGGNLVTWAGSDTLFAVTWYDQSGLSYDLTQATAGSQWTFVLSVPSLNGKSVLRNSDGTRTMTVLGSVTFKNPHDISISTVFGIANINSIVFRINDSATGRMYVRYSALSSGSMRLRVYNSGNVVNIQTSFGFTTLTSYTQMTWTVVNGASPTVISYLNTSIFSPETSVNAWTNIDINTVQYTLGVGTYTGDISEIILFDSALNTNQSQAVNCSQKNYFAT
jgi:hypothetical protein